MRGSAYVSTMYIYVFVCVFVCEELTVTAGWWLAQRPADAEISALAINIHSHSHTYTHVYKSGASIVQAAVHGATEVIMWLVKV